MSSGGNESGGDDNDLNSPSHQQQQQQLPDPTVNFQTLSDVGDVDVVAGRGGRDDANEVQGNGTGHNDDDDDDDDDDEDNWSRQVEVETDGPPAPQTVSESGDGGMSVLSSSSVSNNMVASIPPVPRRDEPTMKEKLVERERQRRVETERARWKRQFALAAHEEDEDDMESDGGGNNNTSTDNVNVPDGGAGTGGGVGGGGVRAQPHATSLSSSNQDDDAIMANRHNNNHNNNNNGHDQIRGGETNSVAGTVGEDTVAGRLETLDDDDNSTTRMNYPMERFLRDVVDDADQRTSNLTSSTNGPTSLSLPTSRETNKKNSSQGVLMARFLQENAPTSLDNNNDNMSNNNHDRQITEPLSGEAIATAPSGLTSPGQQSVNRSVSFDRQSPLVASNDTNNFVLESGLRNITESGDRSNLNHQAVGGMSNIYMSTGSSSFREDESIDQLTNSRAGFPIGITPSAAGSVTNVSTVCMPPSEDDERSDSEMIPVDNIPPHRQASSSNDRIERSESLNDHGIPVSERTVQMADFSTAMSTDTSLQPESPSQPRVVLRLTEAEIQEMAAIDEASRSNAPPSERDDISELGELVSDFGGPVILDGLGGTTLSQGTPTTEGMESASSLANQSGVVTGNMSGGSDHDQNLTGTVSVSSHVVASSAGGDVSLDGNPPSERHEDDEHHHVDHDRINIDTPVTPVPREIIPSQPPSSATSTDVLMPDLPLPTSIGPDQGDDTIVNRKIRPGMVKGSLAHSPPAAVFPDNDLNNEIEHVDDFDFDKNNQSIDGDANNLVLSRNEQWSTGLSPRTPVRPEAPFISSATMPDIHDYGSVGREADTNVQSSLPNGSADHVSNVAMYAAGNDDGGGGGGEQTPLLESGVPAVVAARRRSVMNSFTSIRSAADVHSLAESVFSDIRSEGEETVRSISDDAENYWKSSILQRAFPERLFALIVTLMFEIPVLLMVSGGSDRLCYLIGRTKYQLLIGFLPLSSAISGNVGLQSSTLTTRAISHGQVTVYNYSKWLRKEIGAAAYLGFGMGALLGSIAFVASRFSVPFALTVMIAQFISILTAGITGTFAPLIFTFIFERDSGKWGGPLETAIQDIVGSFA
eukprot:CAMPEP_0113441454 /NCGR_PEP_ID=MMETSP0014_2-20120614/1089_1 /TAXON_ID=2857 /ORGANISM="Nitzschia sp." /LENGTH=1097 /DNA_ID=CAMNT_0000332295 /DNA_START=125 /DNA_END=3415 /DNA_ORIENTATION=- /assembly_acc=CAM_ASM_000159